MQLAYATETPEGDRLPIGRPSTVLIVDDISVNRKLVSTLLEHDGYRCVVANNGVEALERVRDERPDVIVMDVLMPMMDGFEACRQIKNDPDTRLIPVLLITALQDVEDRIHGLEAGADEFVSKPVHARELRARVRSLLRTKCFTDELDLAESVMMSLALTVEARDPNTEGHCERLAAYGAALGGALGLAADDLETLRRGGFLHDVGKIGIPDAILLKRGPLTPDEFEVMKTHTTIGDRLCSELRSLQRVRPIVRWHHERLDGSGYPDRLRGDRIPLLAQILSTVDVFDAMTTMRPYQSPSTVEQALAELNLEVELGWRRRDVVEAFVKLVKGGGLPKVTLRSTAPDITTN